MSRKYVLLAVITALLWGAFVGDEKSKVRAGVKLGGASTVALGGVTNIKEIVNDTPYILEVIKLDGSIEQETGNIPARGVWTGEMWIPWADDRVQFQRHWLKIYIPRIREIRRGQYTYFLLYAWQSGDYVRFNPNGLQRFLANAPRFHGESRAGGERRLIIRENVAGGFEYTLEKYEP